MEPTNLFTEIEEFDYRAMLAEAIETIVTADTELSTGKHPAPDELEALVSPLRRLKQAQARLDGQLTVQPLTKKTFKSRNLELPAEMNDWLKTHRFYLVRVPVMLVSLPGWNFWRLRCQVDFTAENGSDLLKIHDIFPENRWLKILEADTSAELGLDLTLKFNAQMDSAKLVYQNLTGQAALQTGLAAAGTSRIKVKLMQGLIQRPEISTRGLESSSAAWHIEGYRYVQQQEPYLGIVLRVSRESGPVHARGGLIANHRFDLWGAHLTDFWFGKLRDKVQSFFMKGVPLTHEQTWLNILD